MTPQSFTFSGGPFVEADGLLRFMGVPGKARREAVLRELGVVVVRVAGVDFVSEIELTAALEKARAKAAAEPGGTK